jgi:hypothetical protein
MSSPPTTTTFAKLGWGATPGSAPLRIPTTSRVISLTTLFARSATHGLVFHAAYAAATAALPSTGITTPFTSGRAANVASLVITLSAAAAPKASPKR